MRVKSAVDLWIKIIIYMTIAILFAIVMVTPEEEIILVSVSILLSISFLLWFYLGTYYELRDEYLYCKSGPFFEKIPYDKIKSLKLCQNMLSSMALSSKRIEIRQHGKGYLRGTTMISPVDREEFLQELIARCKNLESNNDGLNI